MNRLWYLAILFFASCVLGQVAPPAPQTPAPPPDPFESAWNVSVNGNFSSVSGAATNNGYSTVEAFRIAQHWNLRSDQFITLNPSAVIVLAGPEYRLSLAHYMTKSNFAANASKIEVFGNVKLGTARSSFVTPTATTLSKARFAYGAGAGFDIIVNANLSLRPLDVSYIRAPMLAGGGTTLGNHVDFAAGLGLRF